MQPRAPRGWQPPPRHERRQPAPLAGTHHRLGQQKVVEHLQLPQRWVELNTRASDSSTLSRSALSDEAASPAALPGAPANVPPPVPPPVPSPVRSPSRSSVPLLRVTALATGAGAPPREVGFHRCLHRCGVHFVSLRLRMCPPMVSGCEASRVSRVRREAACKAVTEASTARRSGRAIGAVEGVAAGRRRWRWRWMDASAVCVARRPASAGSMHWRRAGGSVRVG